MALSKETIQLLVTEVGNDKLDTGSVEVQCTLMTAKIEMIQAHLNSGHRKDHPARLGLLRLVNSRTSLMKYLGKKSPERFDILVERLGMRKKSAKSNISKSKETKGGKKKQG